MAKFTDLTSQRFGKLIAVSPTEQRADQGSVVWHCICDCGKERDVSAKRLIRGKTRSCGCLSRPALKDYIGKNFGRLTVIEYAGTASSLGYIGNMHYWKCLCSCGNEAIVGQTELQNGDTKSCGCFQIECARSAMKLTEDTSVTVLERNKSVVRSDNISGKTGVSWESKTQKWVARITFKKKSYWLGRFKEKDDAIRTRIVAEKMHDDFLNWYYETIKIQNLKDLD